MFITGSSSGIGKATARYFQDKGWNVAATMRHPEQDTELQKLPNVLCLQVDVTDRDSIQKAIQQARGHFGKIDVLVNNAGYTLMGPFEGATPQQIQELYDVNVFGVMNVTREILPHFRELGNGCIINVTSLAGRIGIPFSSFYGSSKWAVEGFSESLIYELGKFNIRVKIVEPGAIRTNFAKNAVIVRTPEIQTYEEALNRRIANYRKREGRLSDPIVVAKVIYQAANDSSNRLRYIAGNDARLMWRLRTLLPFRVFSALLRRMTG